MCRMGKEMDRQALLTVDRNAIDPYEIPPNLESQEMPEFRILEDEPDLPPLKIYRE